MAAGTLVVLQPGYLPWLGFFDQMQRSSVFIYYDDVQFDKHGWRNRNRVKAPGGGPHWLTVPVLHSGRDWPAIHEIEIDNRTPWARKHVGTLKQFYRAAPHLHRYLPALEEMLERRWMLLVDLDLWVARARAADAPRVRARHRQPAERAPARPLPARGRSALPLGQRGQGLPRYGALLPSGHRDRVAGLRPPRLSSAARRVRALPVHRGPLVQLRRGELSDPRSRGSQ